MSTEFWTRNFGFSPPALTSRLQPVVGQPEDGVGHPALERLVVPKLLEELRDNLPATLSLNCCIFYNSCLLLQIPFLEDVAEMTGDHG